jgi:thiol-disulfide isomerase/thioredoxin
MKKSLLALFAFLTFGVANAQLADGSLAPNFTGTDLNGNTHTLYEYLQQGYTVVIDVSATWCGPCWSYHETEALKDLWLEHGVDNGGNVVVLFIEGDPTTTIDQLNGIGAGTQGDWVTDSPYPIIDSGEIADLLDIAFFPTIYTVCPSGIITETGQLSAANHWNFINQNACQTIQQNELGLYNYSGDALTCSEAELIVDLANLGSNALTSATINVAGVTPPISFNWTGSLDRLESETVNLGNANVTGTVNITVTGTDTNSNNNSINDVVALAEEATTQIVVNIRFDSWAEEVGWSIRNAETNAVVLSRAEGYYPTSASNTEVWETVYVPASGCYSFTVTDGFSDGLHGSQYNVGSGDDGYINVYSVENGNNFGYIWQYDGSYNYSEQFAAASVTTVVGVENQNAEAAVMNIYPNPANDVANVNFSISENADVVIEVVSLVGQKVVSINKGNLSAGNYIHQLEVENLNAGIYLVNVIANGAVSTMRVTVSK